MLKWLYLWMVSGDCHFADPVADWQKTEAQKKREKLLLDELVIIVDKRDEIVQELDSQERAYVSWGCWG